MVVQLFGDVAVTTDGVRSRGKVLACRGSLAPPYESMLVRVSYSDWTTIRWCKAPLKVLKARGFHNDEASTFTFSFTNTNTNAHAYTYTYM